MITSICKQKASSLKPFKLCLAAAQNSVQTRSLTSCDSVMSPFISPPLWTEIHVLSCSQRNTEKDPSVRANQHTLLLQQMNHSRRCPDIISIPLFLPHQDVLQIVLVHFLHLATTLISFAKLISHSRQKSIPHFFPVYQIQVQYCTINRVNV